MFLPPRSKASLSRLLFSPPLFFRLSVATIFATAAFAISFVALTISFSHLLEVLLSFLEPSNISLLHRVILQNVSLIAFHLYRSLADSFSSFITRHSSTSFSQNSFLYHSPSKIGLFGPYQSIQTSTFSILLVTLFSRTCSENRSKDSLIVHPSTSLRTTSCCTTSYFENRAIA